MPQQEKRRSILLLASLVLATAVCSSALTVWLTLTFFRPKSLEAGLSILDFSENYASLILINVGDVPISIQSVKVINKASGAFVVPRTITVNIGGIFTGRTYRSFPTEPLEPGQMAFISIEASFKPGDRYLFVVEVAGGGLSKSLSVEGNIISPAPGATILISVENATPSEVWLRIENHANLPMNVTSVALTDEDNGTRATLSGVLLVVGSERLIGLPAGPIPPGGTAFLKIALARTLVAGHRYRVDLVLQDANGEMFVASCSFSL